MPEPRLPFEIRLQDPLSKVTRAERKALLGVSAVAIAIARSGLVPTKISALGIDFTHSDQKAFLTTLSAVVLYFLVAFLSYASSDFASWRATFHSSMETWLAAERARERSDEERLMRATHHTDFPSPHEERSGRLGRWWGYRVGRPVSAVRVIVEFALPIAVGLYAIVALLIAARASSKL